MNDDERLVATLAASIAAGIAGAIVLDPESRTDVDSVAKVSVDLARAIVARATETGKSEALTEPELHVLEVLVSLDRPATPVVISICTSHGRPSGMSIDQVNDALVRLDARHMILSEKGEVRANGRGKQALRAHVDAERMR